MKKIIEISILAACVFSSGCVGLGFTSVPRKFVEPERMYAISEYPSREDDSSDVTPVSFEVIEQEIGDPFLAFEMRAR